MGLHRHALSEPLLGMHFAQYFNVHAKWHENYTVLACARVKMQLSNQHLAVAYYNDLKKKILIQAAVIFRYAL